MSSKPDEGKKVRLVQIERGNGYRRKFIYANLVGADNDEMMVSATLDYVLHAVKENKYEVTNWEEAFRQLGTLVEP